jgi:RNA 3'-terminal phosphate cyclase (ATP)
LQHYLTIDGSYGEGGGQIVRSAVSLSAITGKPIQVVNIRAKRENPGLRAQHLSAVKAVADLFHAKVENLNVGADWIRFIPPNYSPPLRSDSCFSDDKNNNNTYSPNNNSSSSDNFEYGMRIIDIGTAGSIPLVLLTIIPAISLSGINHSLQIIGGTDVRYSPTIDYLRFVVRELYARIGINFSIDVLRRGYYPKGGGIVNAQIRAFESPSIQPPTALLSQSSNQPINLNGTINGYNNRIRETTKKVSIAAVRTNTTTIIRTPPRKLMKIKIASVCSELLPKHVAERQLSAAISNLANNGVNIINEDNDDDASQFQHSSYGDGLLTTTASERSSSPGSSILVFSTSRNDNNGWYIGADSIGEKGKRAETVGIEASNRFLENYLKNVPVDYLLADISIVPFSLMKGRSRFRVAKITEHLKTNLYVASRIADGCKYYIEDDSFYTTASLKEKGSADSSSSDTSVQDGYTVNIEVG